MSHVGIGVCTIKFLTCAISRGRIRPRRILCAGCCPALVFDVTHASLTLRCSPQNDLCGALGLGLTSSRVFGLDTDKVADESSMSWLFKGTQHHRKTLALAAAI